MGLTWIAYHVPDRVVALLVMCGKEDKADEPLEGLVSLRHNSADVSDTAKEHLFYLEHWKAGNRTACSSAFEEASHDLRMLVRCSRDNPAKGST